MPNKSVHFPKLMRRSVYSSQIAYSGYRQEIREDCQGRCVYCDAHENELGGRESMTLDHFRPKSFPEYKPLIHDPRNLVWSCRTCNGYKANKWPAIGTSGTVVGGEGFIDPFVEDRNEYFEVLLDGRLTGIKDPAKYLILLLLLNRSGLCLIRQRREVAYEQLPKIIAYFDAEIARVDRLLAAIAPSFEDRARLEEDRRGLLEAKTNMVRLAGLDFTLY